MPNSSTPLKVALTSHIRILLGTTAIDALPRKAHSDDVAHLKSAESTISTLLSFVDQKV
jgi:hypothetical protein